MKLESTPDGSFLLRDSSDDRYLFSLSFKSQGKVHHTRIEHYKGTNACIRYCSLSSYGNAFNTSNNNNITSTATRAKTPTILPQHYNAITTTNNNTNTTPTNTNTTPPITAMKYHRTTNNTIAKTKNSTNHYTTETTTTLTDTPTTPSTPSHHQHNTTNTHY